jgi:hypothetical protein
MAKLWLVDDESTGLPRTIVQFGALRGLEQEWCSSDETLAHLPLGPGSLIALRFDRLRRLSAAAQAALQTGLGKGATLYVRGGAAPGSPIAMGPFHATELAIDAHSDASSYRLTSHPMLPLALAGEQAGGAFQIPGVRELPAIFEPILLADEGTRQRASIFALRRGAGAAIFDLTADDNTGEQEIVFRLADPGRRVGNLGALLAVDHVTNREVRRPVAFNLTLDDRPANYDYLNQAALSRFLDHVQQRLPGAHVDFSWTPNQTHPSRRYVEVQKQFAAGFLWHGLARHVPHDQLEDPEAEIAEGLRLVATIQSRYGVHFQPVMVFPFERADDRCIEVLQRHGFCAMGVSLMAARPEVSTLPQYLRYSLVQRAASRGVAILRRQAIERLPRDLMLAQAALGLPVLSLAHPNDFALKRLPRPWARDSYADLDRVLEFAAAKALRPCSMEQIAAEIPKPLPT